MTPQEILTTVLLAVTGWTLLAVISQGQCIVRIEQQVKDLPCKNKNGNGCKTV